MAAPPNVEHDIRDTLAGSVVGVLPAAFCIKHREAIRIDEVFNLGGCPRSIKRRMFDEPDTFLSLSRINRISTGLHKGYGLCVIGQSVCGDPFNHS